MKNKRIHSLLFTSLALLTATAVIAAGGGSLKDTKETNAGVEVVEDNFFTDDFSDPNSLNRFLRIYDRGNTSNTASISNGICETNLATGYFGTTKDYSNYVVNFKGYNTVEDRLAFTIGNSDPFSTSYLVDGKGNTKENYTFLVVNRASGTCFVRWFSDGGQIGETNFAYVPFVTYIDYEVRVTSTQIEIKLNQTSIFNYTFSSALPEGRFFLIKPNQNAHYLLDNFSIKSLSYNYFDDSFESGRINNNNLALYDRGAADNNYSVSNSELVVNLNNGTFGTKNNFDEYICRFSIYNSAEERVMFMFGNVDLTIGHAGGANMTAGDFYGVVIFANSIGTYFASNIRTDVAATTNLTKTDYLPVELTVTHSYFSIKTLGKEILRKELGEPLPAGKIAFARSSANPVYHINNFSVQPIGKDVSYFTEEFNGGKANRSNLAAFNRGNPANVSMQYNDGNCEATFENGYYGTVNTFETFNLKFRAYCNTTGDQSRFVVAFGGTDLNKGYGGGSNSSSTVAVVMFAPSFARIFTGGSKDYSYPSGTTINNTNYSDFEIALTHGAIDISINSKHFCSHVLSGGPLGIGQIFFARNNGTAVLHLDSVSVQPATTDYYDGYSDSQDNTVLYNRSGSSVTSVSDGVKTFNIGGSDNLATKLKYKDFVLETRIKNVNENRIQVVFGGPSTPHSLNYAVLQNLSSGTVGIMITSTFIRNNVNASGNVDYSVTTGVAQDTYCDLKIECFNYQAKIYVNKVLLETLTLDSNYGAGQIFFSSPNSFANYKFDYIKVRTSLISEEKEQYDTKVVSIEEEEPEAYNSFFKFTLETSDYSGKGSLDVSQTNPDFIDSLNTKDYIRINGIPLSEDPDYLAGAKFINYNDEDSTYAIQTHGNQQGFLYKDSGIEYERGDFDTDGCRFISEGDTCAYEIEIARGCEFPSYSTSSGTTVVDTCFVTDRDYVFIWYDGAFHLSDNAKTPTFVDTRITSVSFTDKGANNKAVNFEFDNFDWPVNVGGSTENIDIHSSQPCLGLNSRVLICAGDENYEITTGERFINLWGAGTTKPSFSLRVSEELDISLVDAVYIFAGAEFPSYQSVIDAEAIASGTKTKTSYLLKTTTRFLSDHEGNFYKATDISAEEYAASFGEALHEVCSSYLEDGEALTKEKLSKKIDIFYHIYKDWMPDEVRNDLTTSTSLTVSDMYERFSYIMNKYDFSDKEFNGFLPNGAVSIRHVSFISEFFSKEGGSIVYMIGLLAVSGIVIALFIKRRKESI